MTTLTEEQAEQIRQERRNPCIEAVRGVGHLPHWWVDYGDRDKPFEYWCPGHSNPNEVMTS